MCPRFFSIQEQHYLDPIAEQWGTKAPDPRQHDSLGIQVRGALPKSLLMDATEYQSIVAGAPKRLPDVAIFSVSEACVTIQLNSTLSVLKRQDIIEVRDCG